MSVSAAKKDVSMTVSPFFSNSLAKADPAIFASVERELGRQRKQIELIASENIASLAVMQAQGTVFTNKYAEGYPGKRYYGGCEFADEVEQLAIDRAKKLFNCSFVNVQPNSGSQANQGVFTALIQPGDTITEIDGNQVPAHAHFVLSLVSTEIVVLLKVRLIPFF